MRLSPAGLVFLGLADPESPLIPPALATRASGYPPRSGTWPRSVVDRVTPDFVTRANEGWFELSRAGGLFGAGREFLIGVELQEGAGDWWWARVRLAESWDLMGAGAAAALGGGFGAPEFVMLSPGGDVIVFVSAEESSIGIVLVREFQDLAGLRELAAWTAGWPGTPEQEKAAAGKWVESISH